MSAKSYYEKARHAVGDVSSIAAARGLGWASLLIGLTEFFAPRKIEQTMGVGNGQNTGILRVLGIREFMHGVDILSHDDPTPGIWSRVAGDLLDGALLGVAAKKTRRPQGLMMIVGLVLPIVLLDVLYAERLGRGKY